MENRQPLGFGRLVGRSMSLPGERQSTAIGLPKEVDVSAVNLPVPQHEEFREMAQVQGHLHSFGLRTEGQMKGHWADRFRTPRSWASEKDKGGKGL